MADRPDQRAERQPGTGTGAEPAGAFAFELTGGDLALDFANTVSRRSSAAPVDHLTDYGRLVSWAEQAGIVTAPQGTRLRAAARERARAAGAVLRQAIAVREGIFSLFSSLAAEKPTPGAALEVLNSALPEALARLRLDSEGRSFAWGWRRSDEDLDAVLPPVVRAAADLLTSEMVERVRECRAETCAWLFLDRSKNGTRCWCDMSVCGNRAKARRHYARGKAASPRVRSRPGG